MSITRVIQFVLTIVVLALLATALAPRPPLQAQGETCDETCALCKKNKQGVCNSPTIENCCGCCPGG